MAKMAKPKPEELHEAIQDHNVDLVKELLDRGASVDAKLKPPKMTKKEKGKVNEEKLKVVWQGIDDDGTDTLDQDELKMVFKGMGKEVSDKKIGRVFRKIDTDGSGQIEYDEFLAWWRKQDVGDGAANFKGGQGGCPAPLARRFLPTPH
jgi:Ca2+-binding EF-hand superfamily protein